MATFWDDFHSQKDYLDTLTHHLNTIFLMILITYNVIHCHLIKAQVKPTGLATWKWHILLAYLYVWPHP